MAKEFDIIGAETSFDKAALHQKLNYVKYRAE